MAHHPHRVEKRLVPWAAIMRHPINGREPRIGSWMIFRALVKQAHAMGMK